MAEATASESAQYFVLEFICVCGWDKGEMCSGRGRQREGLKSSHTGKQYSRRSPVPLKGERN